MRPDALVFACLVLEACCAAKREDEKQSVRAEKRRRSIGVEERGAGRSAVDDTHMTISEGRWTDALQSAKLAGSLTHLETLQEYIARVA